MPEALPPAFDFSGAPPSAIVYAVLEFISAMTECSRGYALKNLALSLERAGKSHGDWPAVGLGDRVYCDYRSLAHRAMVPCRRPARTVGIDIRRPRRHRR